MKIKNFEKAHPSLPCASTLKTMHEMDEIDVSRVKEKSKGICKGGHSMHAFLAEFIRRTQAKYPYLQVVPFGSSARDDWKPSESDLDILVFSNQKVPREVRANLHDMLWGLSQEHGLDLTRMPCPHPPIVFIDGPIKQNVVNWILKRDRLRPVRKALGRVLPKAGIVWQLLRRGAI